MSRDKIGLFITLHYHKKMNVEAIIALKSLIMEISKHTGVNEIIIGLIVYLIIFFVMFIYVFLKRCCESEKKNN